MLSSCFDVMIVAGVPGSVLLSVRRGLWLPNQIKFCGYLAWNLELLVMEQTYFSNHLVRDNP